MVRGRQLRVPDRLLDALLAAQRRVTAADIDHPPAAHGAHGADIAEAAIRTPALQRHIKTDVRVMATRVHCVAVSRRRTPRRLAPEGEEGVALPCRLTN